jgi:predicted Zn-dependent peptidase
MRLRPSLLTLTLAAALAQVLAPGLRAAPAAVERTRTPRGSTVLVQPDRTAPRVAFALSIRSGAADETVATAGWRRLLVDSMLGATRDPAAPSEAFLSGVQLRERLEALGGRLNALVGDDSIEISVNGPSARANALLDLLLAIGTRPRLGQEETERARRGLLRRLDEDAGAQPGEADASARALRRLEERLYKDARGAPLAYALPPGGTLQSLTSLDSSALRGLFEGYFAPGRRVWTLVGDVDAPALRARIAAAEKEGSWRDVAPARPAFAPPSATPPLDVMQLNVSQFEGPAASVFVSYPIDTDVLSAREEAAMYVLAAALGESPRARLPRRLLDPTGPFEGRAGDDEPRLRPRQTVQWVPRRFRGEFVLWAQTGPQQIEAVKNAILDEVRKITSAPLSKEELRAAKNFARGAYFTDRELLRDRASRLALEEIREVIKNTRGARSGGWTSEIEKLSASEVQQAARKYLKPYAVALVMPVD